MEDATMISSVSLEAPARAALPQPKAPGSETARAFEAMVLKPLVETMLPQSEAVYGSGPGADIWRSFMAGAVADALAASGSTGIADLLPDHAAGAQTPAEPMR
jgi:Rod binding domain-containing protein